ncbi:MAG: RCC1 domain-containing protein [Polyangiaceae bacterium]
MRPLPAALQASLVAAFLAACAGPPPREARRTEEQSSPDAAAAPANAEAQSPLGSVWIVEEDIRDSADKVVGKISSVWRRRGASRAFDARWENSVTGEHGRDLIELLSVGTNDAGAGDVVAEGRVSLRRYTGVYDPRRPRHVAGSVFGGRSWEADVLDGFPDAGADAPVVVPAWASAPAMTAAERAARAVTTFPPLVRSTGHAPGSRALNDAKAVASGPTGACAIRAGGAVVCWGETAKASLLGENRAPSPETPRTIRFPADAGVVHAVAVAVGNDFACAIAADNGVWCWGKNSAGALATGSVDDEEHRSPRRVTKGDGSPLRALTISANEDRVCVVTDAGEVLCWGRVYGDANGVETTPHPRLSHALDARGAHVQVGGSFACAMDEHQLSCWGKNDAGELASSDPAATINEDVALRLVVAGAALPFGALAVGGAHACVVDTWLAIWCWGGNSVHQLGDDRFAPVANPKAVPLAAFPASLVPDVIAGDEETCVIGPALAGGGLYCVGGRRAKRGEVTMVAWARGGSVTGVQSAALRGPYKCAIVSQSYRAAGAGGVACWGGRSGEGAVMVGAPVP